MTSLGFALAFFVAAFVSALVGLALREYLADRLRLDHARDMVGGVTGLVVTLVALVFGLLIWTAFGVFSTQKTELQVMAANALEFNQETREYGPEAAHARAMMRADLDWAHKQLWGDDQIKMAAMAASVHNMDSLSVALDHLEPATEAQKSLLADAKRIYAAIWPKSHFDVAASRRRGLLADPLFRFHMGLHCVFSDRAELEIRRRDRRRGGARILLRSQRDVPDPGAVATLLQRHSRLVGRDRPRRSGARQTLKEGAQPSVRWRGGKHLPRLSDSTVLAARRRSKAAVNDPSLIRNLRLN
jgi:hypothetical protein